MTYSNSEHTGPLRRKVCLFSFTTFLGKGDDQGGIVRFVFSLGIEMFQNLLLNKSWCTFQKIKSAVIHGIPLTKSLQCIDVGIAITGSHQSPWSHRSRNWLIPWGSFSGPMPLVALGDLMHRLMHGLMHRSMHGLMYRGMHRLIRRLRVHGFPCLFAVADDQGRVVALALLRGLEVLQHMDTNIRGQLLPQPNDCQEASKDILGMRNGSNETSWAWI